MIEFSYKNKQPVASTAPVLSGTTADKVMFYIANDGSIIISELVNKLNVAERTLKRVIKQLQIDNKIIREGSDKAGIWKILQI